MLKITFYPEYDKPEYIDATREYQNIWDNEGLKITEAIEKVSGLKFVENEINSIIFEGISHSHPLCLRASLESDLKKSNIIHELSHRLVSSNYKAGKLNLLDEGGEVGLESHKQIFLFYYDVLCELYGDEYAQKVAKHETNPNRPEFYEHAWKWVLSMTKEERSRKFKSLKSS